VRAIELADGPEARAAIPGPEAASASSTGDRIEKRLAYYHD